VARPRRCTFCERRPLTNEHILREAWGPRFAHLYDADSYMVSIKPQEGHLNPVYQRDDAPFQLKVKRACAPCNNGWMNALDSEVEDSLLALALDGRSVIPAELVPTWQRWAIKASIMRHFQDFPATPVAPVHLEVLREGGVPPGWRVYVARLQHPQLLHANGGMILEIDPQYVNEIPLDMVGTNLIGFTQTTWALGGVVVVALWSVSPSGMYEEIGHGFAEPFDMANADHGSPLQLLDGREVDFAGVPRIENSRLGAMAWMMAAPELKGWNPTVSLTPPSGLLLGRRGLWVPGRTPPEGGGWNFTPVASPSEEAARPRKRRRPGSRSR
jgi:hypothetical protein